MNAHLYEFLAARARTRSEWDGPAHAARAPRPAGVLPAHLAPPAPPERDDPRRVELIGRWVP